MQKCNKALAILLLLFTHAQCMLKNIKDTYQILNNDYKHLSIAHGAIAWETGFIRRLYDFGQIFPVFIDEMKKDPITQELKPTGRKIIGSYEHLDKTHKTTRLVHALFYRIPGSTSAPDFGITTKLPAALKDNPEKLATTCAELLAYIEQFAALKNQIRSLLFRLANEEGLSGNHKQMIAQLIKNLWDEKKYKALSSVPIVKRASDTDKKIFNNGLASIQGITRTASSLFGEFIINQLKPLTPAQIIIDSLDECDQSRSDVIFSPHTTHMILLGFVYKACSQNRSTLATFYKTLNQKLDNRLLNSPLDDAWNADVIKTVTQQEALATVGALLEQPLQDNFETFVYFMFQSLFQSNSLPTPVGYAIAKFVYFKGATAEDDKSVTFPDCMENALRNFINIMSYNRETDRFDLSYLKKRLGFDGNFNPNLEAFYQNYFNPSEAGLLEAHNAWVELISNIPYVVYIDKTPSSGYTTNFVRVSDSAGEAVKTYCSLKEYSIIADDNYGYNLRPSIKNLILVINHLLNLNLFENSEKAFIQDNFIEVYFPLLCKKLGVQTYYFSVNPQANEDSANLDITEIDGMDFSNPIYTSMVFIDSEKNKTVCKFMTKSSHGEFKVYGGKGKFKDNLDTLLKKTTVQYQGSLNLLRTEILNREEIYLDHVKSQPQFMYEYLFTLQLENTNQIEALINALKNYYGSSMPDRNVCNLLIKLAKKQPDGSYAEDLINKIYISFLAAKDAKWTNEAAERAFEAISLDEDDWFAINKGLFLMDALLKEGVGFQKASELGREMVKSPNRERILRAVEIADKLANYAQGYESATEIVVEVILKTKDPSIYNRAKKILERLLRARYEPAISKTIDFSMILAFIQKSPFDQRKASVLLKLLDEHNIQDMYGVVLNKAGQEIISADDTMRNLAIGVFNTIITFKNKDLKPQILEIARKNLNSSRDYIKPAALKLITLLVNANYKASYKIALEAIESTVSLSEVDPQFKKEVIELINSLYEKDQKNTAVSIGKIINSGESPKLNAHLSTLINPASSSSSQSNESY